jgi:hypothetical protein
MNILSAKIPTTRYFWADLSKSFDIPPETLESGTIALNLIFG